MKAYLDIETDRKGRLCVIGVLLEQDGFVQLYGQDITMEKVESIVCKAHTIVTFNGDYFDLPFIKKKLNLDLQETHRSIDLFKIKKQLGIKGGLKALEKMYGIPRKTDGITGYQAVILWERYIRDGQLDALDLLLEYNKEDVVNLVELEKILFAEKKRLGGST